MSSFTPPLFQQSSSRANFHHLPFFQNNNSIKTSNSVQSMRYKALLLRLRENLLPNGKTDGLNNRDYSFAGKRKRMVEIRT